jgi:hypothetical protein
LSAQQTSTTTTKKQPFRCFRCNEIVKLTRKPDNSGWNRYELDGTTLHNCQGKKQIQQQAQQVTVDQQKTAFNPSTNSSSATDTLGVQEKLDTILKKLETLQKTMELALLNK